MAEASRGVVVGSRVEGDASLCGIVHAGVVVGADTIAVRSVNVRGIVGTVGIY